MNLNDSELESQLREARPASVSAALEQRIAEELSRCHPVPGVAAVRRTVRSDSVLRLFRGLGWAALGAAAAVAAMALTNPATRPSSVPMNTGAQPTPAAEFLQPEESSAELVAARDEGVSYDGNREPVRQLRYRSVERHTWKNSLTGARMEFEVPREDVRLVPVSMQ